MRALALVLLAAGLTLACRRDGGDRWVPEADPALRRTTSLGEAIGTRGRYGGDVWLGLPFARPPVGALRWRAPQPPERWSAPRGAATFAPVCPQGANPLAGSDDFDPKNVVGSEDCLYLNVFAPRFEQGVPSGAERLPVMVWIHGGGNSIGGASYYDPGRLAVEHGVVVVSTQYRLGPFGWFRHPALRGAGTSPEDQSGNYGTLDLIRALEWVRDEISAFGGDPGNVTVFGESAGGQNVFSLLLSPRAKGLFHRAIAQSGVLSRTVSAEAEAYTDGEVAGHPNSSAEVLARLLVRDGRAKDRAQAKERIAAMAPAEVAAYLRSKSPRTLIGAYSIRSAGMLDMPLVFRDGAVLPEGDWLDLFASPGGWNRVPVIAGTNRDEVKLFLFLDDRQIRKVLGFLPRYVDEPRYHAAAEAMSRSWKVAAADGPAQAMRASGATEVFAYRFDWDEQPVVAGADLGGMVGAAHGLEIPFVFGRFELGRIGNIFFDEQTRDSREQLSRAMRGYWTEFARRGAPGRGGGELPEWRPWQDGATYLVLDTAAGGGIRMADAVETLEGIIAAVDADPRLPAQVDKCRVFHQLTQWGRAMKKEDYPRAGQQGCTEFPYEQFPWADAR